VDDYERIKLALIYVGLFITLLSLVNFVLLNSKTRRLTMDKKVHIDHPHPEKMSDEVWLTNFDTDDDDAGIHRPTKRLGKVAYSRSGTPVQGYIPVFCKRSELENEGYAILEKKYNEK